MKYIFKPLNNLHLQLTSAFYLIGLFFDIGFMVSLKDGFNVHFLITCLVISAIPLLLYIFARLGYPYKYEINNNYLIKYKNKSIVFKIRVCDIEYIIVKKANVLNYFKFIGSLFIGDFSTKNLTTMSIIYKKCEVLDESIIYEFDRCKMMNKSGDLKEYVEILSFKKIKIISSLIDKRWELK